MGVILDLDKDEIRAIKLSIDALKEVRKKYAVGENLYQHYSADTQERQHKEYKKYSKAIEILEEWLK